MTPEELGKKYLTGNLQLKSDFQKGHSNREETLTRCERYAGWTLPTLFPRDPLNEYDELQYDYQSIGAMAVTHLANKIMMALFQPSQPFFRNDLSPEQRKEIKDTSGLTDAEIDEILAGGERDAMKLFNSTNNRAVLTDAVMLLIMTGNVLIHTDVKKGMKYWTLRDYIVQKDLEGNDVKILFRETKALSALDDEMAAVARDFGYNNEEDAITIYTCVQRVNKDKFIVWQELEDVCYCHKKLGVYTSDTLPWIPLSWTQSRDKDYGTGLVENYSGAFHTLSTLAEAILDYTTILTDVKTLVDPTGMTDVKKITEAASGAYVPGREEDLHVHTPQVGQAGNFLKEQRDEVKREIAAAFLMNTGVTRDAERVTAEEIRQQAHELESSLGGVYSRLANSLQLPLAKRLSREVDPLFKEITPLVITGLESLSRTSDLDRIRLLFQDLIALADVPEAVSDRINYSDLIAVLGAGHQVDYQKFLLPEKQVKANQEARAKQQAQAAGLEAQAVAQAEQGQ